MGPSLGCQAEAEETTNRRFDDADGDWRGDGCEAG